MMYYLLIENKLNYQFVVFENKEQADKLKSIFDEKKIVSRVLSQLEVEKIMRGELR